MNSRPDKTELVSELLIMPDGILYAHNLTPELAAVLSALNPVDDAMQRRARPAGNTESKKLLPSGRKDRHSQP